MIKLFKLPVKKQNFPLYVDPYRMDCIVFINTPCKEINKKLKTALVSKAQLPEEICKELDAKKMNTAHYLYQPTKGIRLIFIKCSNVMNAIQCFEHEKVHLLHNILDNAGMKLSYKTEEAYAYLFDNITEQFLRRLK